MRRMIRGAPIALPLLLALPAPTPALAQTVGVFSGTANVPNFGSDAGGSDGTFSGSATGTFGGTTAAQAAMSANFSYVEPNATCPIVGTASGTATVTGGFTIGFNWQRVGATAVITGSDGGAGTAAFEAAVTVPCPASGQNVNATVVGTYTAP